MAGPGASHFMQTVSLICNPIKHDRCNQRLIRVSGLILVINLTFLESRILTIGDLPPSDWPVTCLDSTWAIRKQVEHEPGGVSPYAEFLCGLHFSSYNQVVTWSFYLAVPDDRL